MRPGKTLYAQKGPRHKSPEMRAMHEECPKRLRVESVEKANVVERREGREYDRRLEAVMPGRHPPFAVFVCSLNGFVSQCHTTTMADSSLSSVVSSLVRAQMGSSLPSNVTDEDLDRHVADLILKEAKKKSEQYDKQGIRAYLPQSVHPPFPFYQFRH